MRPRRFGRSWSVCAPSSRPGLMQRPVPVPKPKRPLARESAEERAQREAEERTTWEQLAQEAEEAKLVKWFYGKPGGSL